MDNNNFEPILGSMSRLMEAEIKRTHRGYTDEEFLSHGIDKVAKKYNASVDMISDYLNSQFLNKKLNGEFPFDFYCGITNDLVCRKEAHEREDYSGEEIKWMVAVQCRNATVAQQVEMKMHNDFGFYIGDSQTQGNGATDDSDYVYIYRIPK